MTKRDEITYGFSRDDADSLIQMIGGGDSEFPEMRPRPRGRRGGRLARNGGTAIAARSSTTAGSGTVTLQNLSGSTISASSTTVTAYNFSSTTIAANAYIWVEQDGAGNWWVTAEDCP